MPHVKFVLAQTNVAKSDNPVMTGKALGSWLKSDFVRELVDDRPKALDVNVLELSVRLLASNNKLSHSERDCKRGHDACDRRRYVPSIHEMQTIRRISPLWHQTLPSLCLGPLAKRCGRARLGLWIDSFYALCPFDPFEGKSLDVLGENFPCLLHGPEFLAEPIGIELVP
jgi:hypothetical protein